MMIRVVICISANSPIYDPFYRPESPVNKDQANNNSVDLKPLQFTRSQLGMDDRIALDLLKQGCTESILSTTVTRAEFADNNYLRLTDEKVDQQFKEWERLRYEDNRAMSAMCKPPKPKAIRRVGETPIRVVGRDFYHPNFNFVMAEIALSPYNSSPAEGHPKPLIELSHVVRDFKYHPNSQRVVDKKEALKTLKFLKVSKKSNSRSKTPKSSERSRRKSSPSELDADKLPHIADAQPIEQPTIEKLAEKKHNNIKQSVIAADDLRMDVASIHNINDASDEDEDDNDLDAPLTPDTAPPIDFEFWNMPRPETAPEPLIPNTDYSLPQESAAENEAKEKEDVGHSLEVQLLEHLVEDLRCENESRDTDNDTIDQKVEKFRVEQNIRKQERIRKRATKKRTNKLPKPMVLRFREKFEEIATYKWKYEFAKAKRNSTALPYLQDPKTRGKAIMMSKTAPNFNQGGNDYISSSRRSSGDSGYPLFFRSATEEGMLAMNELLELPSHTISLDDWYSELMDDDEISSFFTYGSVSEDEAGQSAEALNEKKFKFSERDLRDCIAQILATSHQRILGLDKRIQRPVSAGYNGITLNSKPVTEAQPTTIGSSSNSPGNKIKARPKSAGYANNRNNEKFDRILPDRFPPKYS